MRLQAKLVQPVVIYPKEVSYFVDDRIADFTSKILVRVAILLKRSLEYRDPVWLGRNV